MTKYVACRCCSNYLLGKPLHGTMSHHDSSSVSAERYILSHLRLTYRRLQHADMPEAMEWPQSVIVQCNICKRRIQRNPQTQRWTKLPNYQYWNFTMHGCVQPPTYTGWWLAPWQNKRCSSCILNLTENVATTLPTDVCTLCITSSSYLPGGVRWE